MLLLLLVVLPGLIEAGMGKRRYSPSADSSMLESLLQTVHRTSRNSQDPHGDQFCVDISSYEPVKWVEEDAQECSTAFVKQCEDKSENVCADVMETKCEVVPYTECTMGVVPIDYSETALAPVSFTPQECVTKRETIPHRKMIPECKNVTKQNCVTLWETDDDGKQVWAGNEACEPVTWQECKLVPKDVKFIVPKVECTASEPLWYHTPQPEAKTQDTNIMTCVVKSTTHCVAEARPDCKSVTYQECKEVAVPSCEDKKVHKPTQEKVHRKKCLLPDKPPAPAADSYGSPAEPPQPTYKAAASREGRRQQFSSPQGRK